MAAGSVVIFMPDGKIEIINNNFQYDDDTVYTSMFREKYFMGFEVVPGVHYHLTPKMIVFLQAKYLYANMRQSAALRSANYKDLNVIQSFGLSTGIYF